MKKELVCDFTKTFQPNELCPLSDSQIPGDLSAGGDNFEVQKGNIYPQEIRTELFDKTEIAVSTQIVPLKDDKGPFPLFPVQDALLCQVKDGLSHGPLTDPVFLCQRLFGWQEITLLEAAGCDLFSKGVFNLSVKG